MIPYGEGWAPFVAPFVASLVTAFEDLAGEGFFAAREAGVFWLVRLTGAEATEAAGMLFVRLRGIGAVKSATIVSYDEIKGLRGMG
jgi:hypothetical protein